MKQTIRWILSGAAAGSVSGLFGAGGGMVLVPLLSRNPELEPEAVFPSSVAIILPICMVGILAAWRGGGLPLMDALPYFIGSGVGGLLAGTFGKRIPAKWLHRFLGLLILYGGVRNLC